MRRAVPLLGSLLLAVAPLAAGQSADELLKAAYGFRRQGEYELAAVSFEQALDRMPRSARKRAVALEAAELFRTMDRLDKALLLFRRNHDVRREVELLMEMGRAKEALAVSRLVRYPKGEALASAALGQVDYAVEVLEAGGYDQALAELLRDERRYREAAEAFARAEDYYHQARCLRYARDRGGARRAYEDAREQVMFRLQHESLPAIERAKQAFRRAPDGVRREQSRWALAQAYEQAGEDYERLGEIYLRTGRDRAADLLELAVTCVEKQRDTLLDRGQDAFGREVVARLGLDDLLSRLRRFRNQLANREDGGGE